MKPPPNAEAAERERAFEMGEALAAAPTPPFFQALDAFAKLYPGGRPDVPRETRQHAVRIELLRLKALRALGAKDERLERSCFALAWMYGALNEREREAEHSQCYMDAVRERRGADQLETIEAELIHAGVLRSLGRLQESRELFRRRLAALEGRPLGDALKSVINAWTSYSQTLEELGLFEEQEAALRRSMELAQPLEQQDPDFHVGQMRALIAFYDKWNRREESDALVWRGYGLANARDPKSFSTALYAWSAASLSLRSGRLADARALLKQAMDLHLLHMGPSYMHIGSMQLQLAEIEQAQGNRAAAVQALDAALAHFRKLGYEVSEQGAAAHRDLAELHMQAGDLAAARREAEAAIAILKGMPDRGGAPYIGAQYTLARVEAAAGRRDAARQAMQEGARQMETRLAAIDGLRVDAASLRNEYRGFVGDYLGLLVEAGDTSASFRAFQLVRQDSTSTTVARSMARAVAQGVALPALLRGYERALQSWRQLDQQLAGVEAAADAAKAAQLRIQREQAERDVAERKTRMQAQFPRYFEFTAGVPVGLDEARRFLGPREAVLAYYFDESRGFAWLVSRDQAVVRRLDIDARSLRGAVKELRESLQLEDNQPPRPFRAEHSQALYRRLVAPFESALGQVDQLTVIGDDALRSLPFALLLGPASGKPECGTQGWLACRFALSELPSVSTFRSVRRMPAAGSWDKPFAGIGAPLLAPVRYTGAAPELAAVNRGSRVSVEDIRRLPSLPDAETELRAMAQTLRASPSDVLVGADATERRVRSLPLKQYKVLAFATHGLTRDGLRGLDEPALVLTPPDGASGEDDGLLTASEIAELDVSADWVILSACNTAASDGSPASQTLSGLARAFFAAGARSLLVSHWYVSSEATTQLTTGMLREYAARPGAGKAAALRAAMLSMMKHPATSHPAFWAPFTLAGDGAR
ncbi:CHAT domain-containing tetratricopeptide repeat protein [Variovorax guangxiensis]|uniref:CHAT domain-containing protein n=1 Tax=Variovorax guangxiensis TaxID=1775474 RepID=UPI0028664205|nr:CHAT domain-containing tetratricopeptide repeat protein [Variovorax guangxiensis]MDR6855307.1 CHAT domain-containing protein [Variovorax guangxiensis]